MDILFPYVTIEQEYKSNKKVTLSFLCKILIICHNVLKEHFFVNFEFISALFKCNAPEGSRFTGDKRIPITIDEVEAIMNE